MILLNHYNCLLRLRSSVCWSFCVSDGVGRDRVDLVLYLLKHLYLLTPRGRCLISVQMEEVVRSKKTREFDYKVQGPCTMVITTGNLCKWPRAPEKNLNNSPGNKGAWDEFVFQSLSPSITSVCHRLVMEIIIIIIIC